MYSVHKITPAGGDWWHVEIIGPNDISVPMRRMLPGAVTADIEALAQAWCDRQNKYFGWIEGKSGDEYRKVNALTISARNRGIDNAKKR